MKIRRFTAVALLMCLVAALAACGALKDDGTYELGKDSITSMAGALGEEHKMNGVSAETKTAFRRIYTNI